jgi:flagellar basal-body rod protein FlgF
MTTAAEISLSYQLVLRNQLDITANNIANSSTPGFQSSHPLFVEYLAKTEDGSTVAYVEDRGTLRNLNAGPLTNTGNVLDLGVQGRGYFSVETDEGVFYTRNGAFRLDSSGQIVTSSGAVLLGEGDTPIVIAPGEHDIRVASDGTVSTENGDIGKIPLVTFDNEQDMESVGNSLLATEQAPIAAARAEISQGMLEGSNVTAVSEITRMIELLRSYQAANQMITTEEERQEQAIQMLTRTV